LINGVNTDLLSKAAAGGAKKSAPPAAKLGKTSTGSETPGGGAFAEQLDLVSRGQAPSRSRETSEKSQPPVSSSDGYETEGSSPSQAEAKPVAPRFKKNSIPAKEQSAEASAPVEPRLVDPGASVSPGVQPTEPEAVAEGEAFAQPRTAGAELAALRQPVAFEAAAKSEEPVSALENVGAEQGQVRRRAMQEFMTQMQSEFGISPQKIVEAFSRLDEQTLTRPPEESTRQFLATLEVPPSKQVRASELYNTMVRATGEAALNEKIAGSEQGVKMTVLSPRDEALRKLNEAIDQLNDSFALRDQPQVTSMAAPLDSSLKAQRALEQMNLELAKMERGPRGDGASPMAGLNQGQTVEDDDSAMAGLLESMGSDAGATVSPSMAGAVAAPFASGAGGESASSMGRQFGRDGGGSASPQSSESNFATQMRKGAPSAEAAKPNGKKVETEAGDGHVSAKNADASLAGAETQTAPIEGKAAAAGPAGMMIQRPTPSAQDEQANVKELIRQAQLAIKKGGGEIKMDLKPEGIGQLHLKVSVENGQVNVQMLTDNDASKRLLEKGLHELKSNLAAHELKVDNMKVDVGQELKKHMDNGHEQAREQTRQFAADVMSQFRDERQAFRDGFMQNQGWRQFGRNYGQTETGRGGAGSPDTSVAGGNSRERARRAGSSGRLDLVA